MEYIKEALIKEVTGVSHDLVFIVENLPKHLLFHKGPKMVPKVDDKGYGTGDLITVQGEFVDTLNGGIQYSQTGDGGFVFDTNHGEAIDALKDIDRYIESSFPRDQRIPKRACYAT